MADQGDLLLRWQRELERCQRNAAAALWAGEQASRDRQRAAGIGDRDSQRRAANKEREERQRYVDARSAEATALTRIVEAKIHQLQSVLVSSLRASTAVPFRAFIYELEAPPVNLRGMEVPIPEPKWEDFEPQRPGTFGRIFGGEDRYRRKREAAWIDFEKRRARDIAAEQQRLVRLSEREQEYRAHVVEAEEVVRRHNSEVSEFESRFHSGDPDVIEGYFKELVFKRSVYPQGFPHRFDVAYRTDSRELVVEYELPNHSVVPREQSHRYIKVRDEIQTVARLMKDVKEVYRYVISQVALRILKEAFDADASDIVDAVIFNGHVTAVDRATGREIRPCLISVSAPRSKFAELVLSEVDPSECLVHLNALVSPHPYDLDPVRPVIDFDLSKYRLVEGVDVVSSLDSRSDLLKMNPTEFEHLVRQLFEAIGLESWVTQASRDEGVDAIAVSKDPVLSGLCVIQAKRYSSVVGLEAVFALAGVMDDKRATKGILITTSWFGKASRDFVARHGRIELHDCHNLTYLLKKYLNKDVLISLPKPPPAKPR